jgi:hypothetical protein
MLAAQSGCVGRELGPLSPPAITQSIECRPFFRNHGLRSKNPVTARTRESAPSLGSSTKTATAYRQKSGFRRSCPARRSMATGRPKAPCFLRFEGALSEVTNPSMVCFLSVPKGGSDAGSAPSVVQNIRHARTEDSLALPGAVGFFIPCQWFLPMGI